MFLCRFFLILPKFFNSPLLKQGAIMFTQTVYDAFTGISPHVRHKLVKFLYNNQGECEIEKTYITSSIEYAMKERPSFGGFILTAEREEQIVAAMIVNKTGMTGYGPEHILVYFGADETTESHDEVSKELLQKIIKMTGEDIAFLVTPDNPWKAIFRKLGFEAQLLEMNYSKPVQKQKRG